MVRALASIVLAGVLLGCDSPKVTIAPTVGPVATQGAWTTIELPQVGATTNIGAVLADENGFVLAGQINDVAAAWTSPDGTDWTIEPLPGTEGITPTSGFSIDGRVVLVGGGGTDRCAHPAMAMTWARPTGGDWAMAPFDKILCGNPYVSDLVSNGDGMLLVGTGFGEVGLTWASNDGLHWLDVAPPGFRDSLPRAAVWTGTEYIVLAVGDPATDVWTSSDGQGWTKSPDALPTSLSAASMAVLGDTVIALVQGNDDKIVAWQRPPDGSWSVINIPGLDPEVTLQRLRVVDGRFLFLGAVRGHPLIVAWRPGDATASAIDGPDGAIDLLGFAIKGGTVVLLGGVGTIDERLPAAWSAPASILP